MQKKLLPFDALISMNVSIQGYNLVVNGWNFTKLLLNLYGHGTIIHISFIKMSSEVKVYCQCQ